MSDQQSPAPGDIPANLPTSAPPDPAPGQASYPAPAPGTAQAAPPAYAPPVAPPSQPAFPPPPGGTYAPQPVFAPAPLPAVLQGRTLASWGDRFLASLVDGLVAITIIGIFVNWFMIGRQGDKNGMSIGKQAIGIRIVRENGEPMTLGTAILREFVIKTLLIGFVGWFLFGIPFLLDYLWPLWDSRNQALHDKIASTYVVKG